MTIGTGQARLVSTSGNTLTVQLRHGAAEPRVGAGIVIKPFPRLPSGAVGIVESISRPGRRALVTLRQAALSQVFSALKVEASGYLGELSAGAAGANAHTSALGPLSPDFSCSGSAPSPHVDVDLSQLKYTVDISLPNYVQAFIGGPMKFGVGFDFTAAASCSAALLAHVPLGETGLILDVGPELSVHAGGAASAAFTWTPRLTYAFFRSRSGVGDTEIHEFKSSGQTEFTGAAEVGLGLGLKVAVKAFDKVGLEGTIGPSLDEKLESAHGQICRVVEGSAAADLNATAKIFDLDWNFNLAHLTFWRHALAAVRSSATATPTAATPSTAPARPRTGLTDPRLRRLHGGV